MRRLLVTGGAGFIGANFVAYWLARHRGDRVVVLDSLTYAGTLTRLAGCDGNADYRFVRGDIRDREAVSALLRDEAIDTVVHFAAESHVDRSILGPEAFVQTNVVGTHALLQAARQVWLEEKRVTAHRFHHVSTDEVYGSLQPQDPPFSETTPYAPNSPYSASKAASDHLVRAYAHTYGLQTTVSNCSNNYGPLQFPEKLIPLMLLNALRGLPLPVYGRGENVRDWLHVEDHCRAIELIIERGRTGATYNVGGESERRNLDVVRTLCALVDECFREDAALARRHPAAAVPQGRTSEQLIRFVTDRPGHDLRYAIDGAKIARELGFRPSRDFESGLRQTVHWYLGAEAWWGPIVSGDYRAWEMANYGDRLASK